MPAWPSTTRQLDLQSFIVTGCHFPGDQPSRPAADQVILLPPGERQQSVLKLEQMKDVDEQPGQPVAVAIEPCATDVGQGAVAAGRGHVSFVEIAERAPRGLPLSRRTI